MKVDFILIGAHKAGTTSLAYYLSKHPDICFSKIKEPHFFTQTNPQVQTWEQYQNLFSPQPGQLLGEASINCTMPKRKPRTEQRIFEHNPQIKLIYLLRNPVERIASAYRYRYMNNWTKRPVEQMEQEIREGDYLEVSNYYKQITSYLNFFGLQQIYFCLYEDMKAHPVVFMKGICDFLNLSFPDSYQTESFYVNKKRTADEKGLNATGRFISSIRLARLFPHWLVQKTKNLFLNKLTDIPPFSDTFTDEIKGNLKADMLLLQKTAGINIRVWGY